MVPKLVFGLLITVVAIVALLLILIVVGGIIAGLLAPFVGSVPISYNFRSIKERWTSTIVAVLGIAGTVGVFVAMLSLARGFKATLVASGSPSNALIMRAGSSSEMMGGITLDSVRVAQDAPGVAHDANGPLVTQEVVGVVPLQRSLKGGCSNPVWRNLLWARMPREPTRGSPSATASILAAAAGRWSAYSTRVVLPSTRKSGAMRIS